MQHLPCINFFIFICPLLAVFFSLLAAKGHIAMKINFILDPLGADVSANLCQDRFKMMAKRKFLYFISVLYCPVFLIMEPGKTGNPGLFFCLAHLPTMDTMGLPCPPDFSLVICETSCDSPALWCRILTCRSSFARALGDLRLGQPHFTQGLAASEGQPHCWQWCFLSVISLFDIWCVSILCVHWKPNVIAQR